MLAGKVWSRFRRYALPMDDFIICGFSAFQYYRTPPRVLAMYPGLVRPRRRYASLAVQPLSRDIFGGVIDVLVVERSDRCGARHLRYRLWQGETPLGHIRETDHGFKVVSPEFALFQMAPRLSRIQLVMAMMELCGYFSIFKPADSVEAVLSSSEELWLPGPDGWRRTRSQAGNASDLWQRKPLTSVADLQALAFLLKGRHGSAKFSQATELITGAVASPFEAQASLLFSLSRKQGGEGFSDFENNAEVRMTHSARLVSGLSKCYVDLLFPGFCKERSVAVECQGRIAHGLGGLSMSDANRILALETMGFDVVPLTYEQIFDADRFRAVVRVVAQKTGHEYLPKTPGLLEAERVLRSQLFIDWGTLGSMPY